MLFKILQPLKLTFKQEQKYLETEDQPLMKVVYLRTRNPKNFSLYFSDLSCLEELKSNIFMINSRKGF